MLVSEEELRAEIKQNFVERIINCFLDVIILSQFYGCAFDAKDVVRSIQRTFGPTLGSHKVHSTIYSMQRKKLITSVLTDGKIIYRLTEKGKLTVEVTTEANEIKKFMEKLMMAPRGRPSF